MATIQQKINGFAFSHSSIEVQFAGKTIVELQSVDYGTSRDRGDVYGTGVKRLARTQGQEKNEASCQVTREGYQDLLTKLRQLGQQQNPVTGIQDTPFSVVVSFQEAGQPRVVDTLSGCLIDENKLSSKVGSDATMVDLTLNVMDIQYDNNSPFQATTGA